MDRRTFLTVISGKKKATPWYLSAGVTPILAYDANAASYEASLVNLVNPGTNNLTAPVAAPTWDTSGWTMSATGLGKFFDTGYTPAAGSYSIFMQYVSNPTSYFFGCWPNNTTGILALRIPSGGTLRVYLKNTDSIDYTTLTNNAGKFVASKGVAYIDGVPMTKVGGSGAVVDVNASSLYFGACNRFDGVYLGAGKFSKFALYSGILTPTQMATLTNP